MKRAFWNTSRFSWFLDNRAENSVQIAEGYTSEPLKKYDKEYLLDLAASGQILDHVIRETDKAVKIEATKVYTKVVTYGDLPGDIADTVRPLRIGEKFSRKGVEYEITDKANNTVSISRARVLNIWVPRTCLPQAEYHEIPDIVQEGRVFKAKAPGAPEYYRVAEVRPYEAHLEACNKKGEATGAIDIYVRYKDLEGYIVMEVAL